MIDEETRSYKIKLTSEMLGTVAKNQEIYKTYIESRKPANITEDESETVENSEETGWTGFHKDDNGLFIYGYMISGFLKNAGISLKSQIKISKTTKSGVTTEEEFTTIKSKIDKYVFVNPRKIYLNKMEPDGVLERSIRVLTPKGPRVALVKSDFINEGTEITFEITIIKNNEINFKLIDKLLEYGKYCGIGQFRNGSYGRFEIIN
jgi:hypothetical protein